MMFPENSSMDQLTTLIDRMASLHHKHTCGERIPDCFDYAELVENLQPIKELHSRLMGDLSSLRELLVTALVSVEELCNGQQPKELPMSLAAMRQRAAALGVTVEASA